MLWHPESHEQLVARARERDGRGRFSLWTGDPGTAVYLRACLEADPRVPFYERF